MKLLASRQIGKKLAETLFLSWIKFVHLMCDPNSMVYGYIWFTSSPGFVYGLERAPRTLNNFFELELIN